MKKRIKPAPDFAGFKGPPGYEAQARKAVELPWNYVEEWDSMRNTKMRVMIRDAGVALARTVIEHGTPSERLDAVEHWLATAIRPRTKAYVAIRAANPEFIKTCTDLARAIVKAKPNGK